MTKDCLRILLLLCTTLTLISCGGATGSSGGTGNDGVTGTDETSAEASRLSTVETELLSLINDERQASGLPALARDSGLDTIMLWHVTHMATEHFLNHEDINGRDANERVQYYSGNISMRCSEIIQWWGGNESGQVHYQGYYNSPRHHDAYMEQGIYNLGGAEDVGIAAMSGPGPKDSEYAEVSGSYTGLVICDQGVTLDVDPFSE
ncbi:MAG: CAP domain-containing protein [Pseudomonadota bacterium]